MASLAEYCVRLARDPECLKKFRSSPEEARKHMRREGLSDEQQELLFRADPDEISKEIAKECPIEAGGIRINFVIAGAIPTRPGGAGN